MAASVVIELNQPAIVVSPQILNRGGGHKRRAAAEPGMRLALAGAIAPVVSRLTTEAVRHLVGDSGGNAGQLRRDLADIKARRIDDLGMSRLLFIAERLSIDPWAAIAVAAPRARLAS